jgi:hypothetical protein
MTKAPPEPEAADLAPGVPLQPARGFFS